MNALNHAHHPCFSQGAHHHFSRVHLPVAFLCNVSCNFCDRRYSCVNESRPGVTAELMRPHTALAYLEEAASKLHNLTVVGIAGPGDPLANPKETFKTLAMVRKRFPRLMTCVSTNGLALPESAQKLFELGVSHVTVTINAASSGTAAKIYSPVGEGPAESHAAKLLAAQEKGVRILKALGLTVKINTVLLPGINDGEIVEIAKRSAAWGADLMNCIPLIPVPGTKLGGLPAPDTGQVRELREKAGEFIAQMRHCSRCRADAAGLLGAPDKLSDYRLAYQVPPA